MLTRGVNIDRAEMRLAKRCVTLSAALAAGGAMALSAPRPRAAVVPLASSVCVSSRPTCVLVHGLDSSKSTFAATAGILAASGYPTLVLDLRGHGESPLGDQDDFSPDALANNKTIVT